MDELSYDQVFEHRQADVKLPHFDQFKNESVVFSNVQPEGYYTDRILPALLLGRRVDEIQSSMERDLEIHEVAASRWVPFDQNATIFADAQREGWSTGVVGWSNPYCHILRDVLNFCFWDSVWVTLPGTRVGEQPTLADVMEFPLKWAAGSSQSPTLATAVEAHTLEHANVMNAADSLIKNAGIDFEFIHLPVPHPPGIYDRKTGTLGVPGSYLDNLVLADRDMGNLLDLIGKTSSADRTTLIVSSDHSFRVGMWRDLQMLTPEGMRATGGKFDPRPVLMIRFPDQDGSEVRPEQFPLLGIHGILEGMLSGEIRSRRDLDQWLSVHESAGEQVLAEKGE